MSGKMNCNTKNLVEFKGLRDVQMALLKFDA